jgi:hypothetical protein
MDTIRNKAYQGVKSKRKPPPGLTCGGTMRRILHMVYIVIYLIVSILASFFIGRFIYVGHAEEENSALGRLEEDEKGRPGMQSKESSEKVSRDSVPAGVNQRGTTHLDSDQCSGV